MCEKQNGGKAKRFLATHLFFNHTSSREKREHHSIVKIRYGEFRGRKIMKTSILQNWYYANNNFMDNHIRNDYINDLIDRLR